MPQNTPLLMSFFPLIYLLLILLASAVSTISVPTYRDALLDHGCKSVMDGDYLQSES